MWPTAHYSMIAHTHNIQSSSLLSKLCPDHVRSSIDLSKIVLEMWPTTHYSIIARAYAFPMGWSGLDVQGHGLFFSIILGP